MSHIIAMLGVESTLRFQNRLQIFSKITGVFVIIHKDFYNNSNNLFKRTPQQTASVFYIYTVHLIS